MNETTDPRIGRMLLKLKAIWEKRPELRFGQLVWALIPKGSEGDPFYVSDTEWESAMDRWIAGNS